MAVQLTVPGKGERAVGRSGWFSGPWSRQEDSLGKNRDTYRVLTSDLSELHREQTRRRDRWAREP